MKFIISATEAFVWSLVSSVCFVSAIYVKNYFVDSPMYSDKYKYEREKLHYIDFSLHATEIKQRTISISIAITLCLLAIFGTLNVDFTTSRLNFYPSNENQKIDESKLV